MRIAGKRPSYARRSLVSYSRDSPSRFQGAHVRCLRQPPPIQVGVGALKGASASRIHPHSSPTYIIHRMMTGHPVACYTLGILNARQREGRLAGGRAFDKPATYEVCVKGVVDATWASYWFEGFTVRHLPHGESVLTGQVADQSALLGLLAQMRDLGLPILSVRQIVNSEMPEEEAQDGKDDG
jgi:hypothetical protein